MSMNDTTAAALSKIMNAERAAKTELTISPSSKMLVRILEILKDAGYIGDYYVEEDSHGQRVTIRLENQINELGPIKPRYAVGVDNYERYEKRYLAAKDFGFLIVSTSQGIMTHKQAKERNIGGRLVAYCY